MDDDEAANYDEFAMLEQYANHEHIAWHGRPQVRREHLGIGDGRSLSCLVWGASEPEAVLLHGGGQNAHTWDSVAMALDRPVVAFDLPGHGHSDWRDDHDYGPEANAEAVAHAMRAVAPRAEVLVGMSLGGMTAIRLAAHHPDLVRRVVIVDITPGSGPRRAPLTREQRGATVLLEGPKVFDSFDEILAATAAAVPGRPLESLRPGVLHNSRRLADGRWAWRYDPERGGMRSDAARAALWDDVSAIHAPVLHVRGGRSAMVHEDDLAEFEKRQPSARFELFEEAGHSVQSDRPVQLAALITEFIAAAP